MVEDDDDASCSGLVSTSLSFNSSSVSLASSAATMTAESMIENREVNFESLWKWFARDLIAAEEVINLTVAVGGETLLMAAADAGDAPAIRLLIDHGASGAVCNPWGRTALMKACTSGSIDAVTELILAEGTDLFQRDTTGKTALDWARIKSNDGVVKLLEETVAGHIERRQKKLVSDEIAQLKKKLVKSNRSLREELHRAIDESDVSAMLAVAKKRPAHLTRDELSSVLRGLGEDPSSELFFVDAESDGGWTALTRAAMSGELELVRTLFENGARVDHETKLGHTAVTWACVCGHADVVEYLVVEARAEVNRQTVREGRTALMVAAANAKRNILQFFVQKLTEAALEQRHKFVAAQSPRTRNRRSLMRPFLEEDWLTPFQQSLDMRCMEGKTAFDYATDSGDTVCMEMLSLAVERVAHREQFLVKAIANARPTFCGLACGARLRADQIELHELRFCANRVTKCDWCQEPMAFKELGEHADRHCAERKVYCRVGCCELVSFRLRKVHEEKHCKVRTVNCRLGCGYKSPLNKISMHEVDLCPMRVVQCDDCRANLLGGELRSHLKTACPKRLVNCQQNGGCGLKLPEEIREAHEQEVCENRPLPCRWSVLGCKDLVGPASSRRLHETQFCAWRPAKCSQGCGKPDLFLTQQPEHEEAQCPKRSVECPLRCGEEMPWEEQPRHVLFEWGACAKRRVRCRYDYLSKRIEVIGPKANQGDFMPENVVVGGAARDFSTAKHEGEAAFAEQRNNLAAASTECVRPATIVKFNPEDGMHLLQFADHKTVWRFLDKLVCRELDDCSAWRCDFVSHDFREQHEAKCPLRPVKCSRGCGQVMPAHAIKEHETPNRCPNWLIECRLGCQAKLFGSELHEHETEKCIYRKTRCEHCEELVPHNLIPEHENTSCPFAMTRCTLLCSMMVRRIHMAKHQATDCRKRTVVCEHPGCGKSMWVHELEEHEESCGTRPVDCPNVCGMEVTSGTVAQHLREVCPQRMEPCPLDCGVSTTVAQQEEHILLLCSRRLSICSNGCGGHYMFENLSRHQNQQCPMREVACPQNCGQQLPLNRLAAHGTRDCPKRRIRCPRCDHLLRAEQLEGHQREQCDMTPLDCGAHGKQCQRPLRAWIEVDGRIVNCDSHQQNGFMKAIEVDDVISVTLFLQRIAREEVDKETTTGHTPLSLACFKGRVTIARLLIEAGADVNCETSRGRTPLSEACLSQSTPMLSFMLHHARANVLYRCRFGNNAAVSAVKKCDNKEIRELLMTAHKREVEQRRLFLAISLSDYDTVQELVAGGPVSRRMNEVAQLAFDIEKQEKIVQAAEKAVAEDEGLLDEVQKDCIKWRKVVRSTDAKIEQMRDSVKWHRYQKRLERGKEERMFDLVQQELRGVSSRDCNDIMKHREIDPAVVPVLKAVCLLLGVEPNTRRGELAGSDDWAAAARTLLMSRHLLERLEGYKDMDFDKAILERIRVECFSHPAFPLVKFRDGVGESEAKASMAIGGKLPGGGTAELSLAAKREAKSRPWSRDATQSRDDIRSPSSSRPPTRGRLEGQRRLKRLHETGGKPDILVIGDDGKGDDVGTGVISFGGAIIDDEEEQEPAVEVSMGPVGERHGSSPYSLINALSVWVIAVNTTLTSRESVAAHEGIIQKLDDDVDALNANLPAARFRLRSSKNQVPAREGDTGKSHRWLREAKRELLSMKRQLWVCRLLDHRAVTGHNALTWAASRGDVQVISDLCGRGAVPEFAETEIQMCASFIQRTFRHYRWEITKPPWNPTLTLPFINRRMAHKASMNRLKLEIAVFRQSSRVAILECAYAGHRSAFEELISRGCTIRRWTHIYPCAAQPYDMRGPKSSEMVDVPIKGTQMWLVAPLKAPMGMSAVMALGVADNGAKAWRQHEKKGWTDFGYNEELLAVGKKHVKRTTRQVGERERKKKTKVAARLRHEAQAHAARKLEQALCNWQFSLVGQMLEASPWLADHETPEGTFSFKPASAYEMYATNADGQRVSTITLLLDRTKGRPSLDWETAQGLTPLIVASRNEYIMAVQELCDRGADVNYQSKKNGTTALMAAAANGKLGSVKLLLERGANTEILDADGHNARHFAVEHSSVEIANAIAAARYGNVGNVVASAKGVRELIDYRKKLDDDENAEAAASGISRQEAGSRRERGRIALIREQRELEMARRQRKQEQAKRKRLQRYATARSLRKSKEKGKAKNDRRPQSVGDGDSLASTESEEGDEWLASAVLEHATDTEIRVPCSFGCGTAPLEKFKAAHEAVCPKRIIECRYGCGVQELWADEEASHYAEECPRRTVPCEDCQSGVPWEDMDKHRASTCDMRRVECPFRCGKSPFGRLLDKHVRSLCPRRPSQCKHCGREMPLASMNNHLKQACPFRLVRCRQNCGREIIEQDRTVHEEQYCPQRIVECQWQCGSRSVTAAGKVEHETQSCPARLVLCKLRCGEAVKEQHMDRHCRKECPHRFVACQQACGMKVRFGDLREHMEQQCAARQIACSLGCGEHVAAGEMRDHQRRSCTHRPVTCALSCGESVPAGDLDRHKANECRRRVIECPLGCGKAGLLAEALEDHINFRCRKRTIFCRLGCGTQVKQDKSARHEQGCTMRMTECSLGCGAVLREKERKPHEMWECSRRKMRMT